MFSLCNLWSRSISLSRKAAAAWHKKKENISVKKIVYDHANGSQIGWKIIKCEINFVFTIALAPRSLEYNDDELCWRQRYGDLREFRALHCMILWPYSTATCVCNLVCKRRNPMNWAVKRPTAIMKCVFFFEENRSAVPMLFRTSRN